MFLHLPSLSPLHFPSRKSHSPSSSKALSLLFHTFEDNLDGYLKSLIPDGSDTGAGAGAPPAVSFSYLSRAVGALSSVHALAEALIADPSLSGADEAAVASYVASSIKVLDVCNAVSAEIERLHRRRLLLLFAAHLLSSSGASPPPEKVRKAREAIDEWGGSPPGRGVSPAAADLVRDLARGRAPPRGAATALGRAICAVEAASALIAGAVVNALGGDLDLAAAGPKAPGEFLWSEAFNELQVALTGGVCSGHPRESVAVEAAVRNLTEVVEGFAAVGDDDEEKAERLRKAVKELEHATEELSGGLDPLGGAVRGLFRSILGARNTALESFRVCSKKCK